MWFRRHPKTYDRKKMYLDHLDSVRHFQESYPDGGVDNARSEILSEMLKETEDE